MKNVELPKNMNYINGVEFSTRVRGYNCHVLGYGFNRFDLILEECKKIRNRKISKIIYLVEYLRGLGIDFTDCELACILKKQGSIGRIDICRCLIDKGYGSRSEIYDKYLSIPLPSSRSDLAIITDVIHKSGGFSVLAHPKEIEVDYNVDINDLIFDFLSNGLDGIEVFNSIHDSCDVNRYLALASKYNLLVTGGSDFHGSTHPERILGKTMVEQKVLKMCDINFCSKR